MKQKKNHQVNRPGLSNSKNTSNNQFSQSVGVDDNNFAFNCDIFHKYCKNCLILAALSPGNTQYVNAVSG